MDNRLAPFEVSKDIALKVKGLISTRTQSEYDSNHAVFKKYMTESLLKEYFPSKEYLGGEKYFTLNENSITGEILNDKHFVFKLDLVLVQENMERPLVLLVYIKDTKIYRIQSLG